MDKTDILSRIPYLTAIGSIFIIVGGAVVSSTTFLGIKETEDIAKRRFVPIANIQYAGGIILCIGGAVITLGLVVLIFAALTNSATHGSVFRGDSCLMGGQNSAVLFMGISYFFTLVWLILSLILVIPTLFWIMMRSVCFQETGQDYDDPYHKQLTRTYENLDPRTGSNPNLLFYPDPYLARQYTFNLTHYGIYLKPDNSDSTAKIRQSVAYEDMQNFCSEISTTGPFFACSLGGSVLVVLGLSIINACLASYYMKLKLTKELTKYKKCLNVR
ncbi:CCT complex interacting protein [Cichlidogyrus casuarinus]|uniref:CCT complex interacting protein n=1 Tax=Cichlidogyrus casuarinus TaxID=1844966 RepID=A0ABD2Q4M8_9PLAT